MQDILEELNESQRLAVTATEGVVRVIAGAGSGKTGALAHRFAYLVNDCGIPPGNILCVTFTNKAAAEMRTRIHNLTGDNDTGYINTFHGFCVSVLQEDSHVIKYPRSFLVLDNSDIDQMLQIIYEERGLTLSDMTFARARDMIEMQKLFAEPEYYLELIGMSSEELHQKYLRETDVRRIIFYGYLYQEKKCFALDYNDLIKFTLYIFEQDREVRHKWQTRLEYIMVDEFQDIDKLQYDLMKVLAGFHRNLFIVGDTDQTIYTWRGANVKYLLDFDSDYPECQTIMMMQNYRSTPEIVSLANSLIRANRDRIAKDLIPMRAGGPAVICHYAGSARAEAEWICGEIEKLHGRGVPYRDITVLYRAHYLTRTLEEVFIDKKLPYAIYSGVQFFDRTEIKDALSWLRMIALRDDLSFMRVVNKPRRNIGKARIASLREYADQNRVSLYQALQMLEGSELFRGADARGFIELIEHFGASWRGVPISELLSAVLDQSGYERMLRTAGSQERLDNLAELKQSIYEFETSCGEECDLPYYLAHVAMFRNDDAEKAEDRVRLMTVHAAKGLEFPYVFLCAMNEGIFPTKKTLTLSAMEEERRLAFVAVTRAEDGLYLSEAGGRDFDGAPRYPSRFLLDVDQSLLSFTAPPREGLIAEARAYIDRTNRFLGSEAGREILPVGTRVRHSIFGTGTVDRVDTAGSCYIIVFDDLATPRRITFRAKLEKC